MASTETSSEEFLSNLVGIPIESLTVKAAFRGATTGRVATLSTALLQLIDGILTEKFLPEADIGHLLQIRELIQGYKDNQGPLALKSWLEQTFPAGSLAESVNLFVNHILQLMHDFFTGFDSNGLLPENLQEIENLMKVSHIFLELLSKKLELDKAGDFAKGVWPAKFVIVVAKDKEPLCQQLAAQQSALRVKFAELQHQGAVVAEPSSGEEPASLDHNAKEIEVPEIKSNETDLEPPLSPEQVAARLIEIREILANPHSGSLNIREELDQLPLVLNDLLSQIEVRQGAIFEEAQHLEAKAAQIAAEYDNKISELKEQHSVEQAALAKQEAEGGGILSAVGNVVTGGLNAATQVVSSAASAVLGRFTGWFSDPAAPPVEPSPATSASNPPLTFLSRVSGLQQARARALGPINFRTAALTAQHNELVGHAAETQALVNQVEEAGRSQQVNENIQRIIQRIDRILKSRLWRLLTNSRTRGALATLGDNLRTISQAKDLSVHAKEAYVDTQITQSTRDTKRKLRRNPVKAAATKGKTPKQPVGGYRKKNSEKATHHEIFRSRSTTAAAA